MPIVASAPGRAGILGNPTDGYGGSVLSCSLEQRARVALHPSDGLEVAIGEETVRLRGTPDFQLKKDRFDVARAVLRFFRLYDLPLRIEVSTTIPIQAGLAGSTAILTAMVTALRHWLEQPPWEKHYLAEIVRAIELNYLEIQCGYQDQYMSVFGGLNYMDFRGKEHYRHLRGESYGTIENLDAYVPRLPLLIAHTGRRRVSGQVLRPVRERWEEGDREVVEGYRRIAELARQGKRALLEGNWNLLARLMNENHRIQQRLGASGEENDRFIELALAEGALAAKLAGAGGGGTILALLDPDDDPARLGVALRHQGAAEVITPKPSPGVRLECGEEEGSGVGDRGSGGRD
jgi:galactokinase/mevalonate kinase-like predicted kinase